MGNKKPKLERVISLSFSWRARGAPSFFGVSRVS
jgi:hypothetical protein